MNTENFIKRQVVQIRQGGRSVLLRKVKLLLSILLRLPLFILSIPLVVVIKLIKPWLLVRWCELPSPRIGHFATNTELYLCERDAGISVPKQRYVDIFFLERPICNQQLAKMWKRTILIWPAWLLSTICSINRLIPGGTIHEIGNNTQNDRDVHNLLDRFPAHLKFTSEEESRGEAGLKLIGIPKDTPFICLIVRDSAYLDNHQVQDWSYHNYRDCDIQNFVLAAEDLADRGYFVIRMGAKVYESIKSDHPRVIDYATNGMRNDFMDIYLGAKCEFCITSGLGFDAVPIIFRTHIVSVGQVPVGWLRTFLTKMISISKHHIVHESDRKLTLSEIFKHKVGFGLTTSNYELNGIKLVENTPEEIRDVCVEMVKRLNGSWISDPKDEVLQNRFWEIYCDHIPNRINTAPIHGEIKSRIGANFLRKNSDFLEWNG